MSLLAGGNDRRPRHHAQISFHGAAAGATVIGEQAWSSPPRPMPGRRPPRRPAWRPALPAPRRTSTWPGRTASARRPGPRVQGVVHRRRRGALRRLRADHRQHQREHAAVRGDRRRSTFTDLQTRDMTYTVAADPSGMACTVTSTDAKHGFRLVTTYITDPARDTVLMHTTLEGVPGSSTKPGRPAPVRAARRPRQRQRRGRDPERRRELRRGRHQHRHDPIPVVFSTNTVTNAVNRTYAVPTYMALAREHPVTGRERRLRGHRQRRPHPARRDPRPHPVQLGARRPHRGHRGTHPGPRRPGDPGPRLRPHPGPGDLDREQLPEPPVRPGRAAVPRRLGRLRL